MFVIISYNKYVIYSLFIIIIEYINDYFMEDSVLHGVWYKNVLLYYIIKPVASLGVYGTFASV
jgi:hypothetical protein